MTSLLVSSLRSGLIALGLVAGFAAPSFAGPANLAVSPAERLAGGPASQIIPIQDACGTRRCLQPQGNYRGDGGRRHFNRRHDGGPVFGGHSNYRRHWNGNNDGRWRRHYRHHRPRYYGGSGVYLGLGFGVPAYRYVQPRRVYRGGSSAHVRWCYNRYRSYRAWDNTFQPYNGPRQQCWSPYS
ncbi:BA14K family protein [Mesorhizobium sp. BE184]|uniref:BA14K family protein n=1 Tax=Mesorhizobium sp. BE184 TaxID=2817714 RepID=UPI00286678CD|nr:BA14K family protein [Mesorhizobium sp. BE184]MDR7035171.1 hypothetical protein [Mesorhizobium sp. BE184]